MRNLTAHFFTIQMTLWTALGTMGCGSNDGTAEPKDTLAALDQSEEKDSREDSRLPTDLADSMGKDQSLVDAVADGTADQAPLLDVADLDPSDLDDVGIEVVDVNVDSVVPPADLLDAVEDLVADGATDTLGDGVFDVPQADLDDTGSGTTCCKQDMDCGAGKKCVGGAFASGGWCVAELAGDECYTLADCPVGHLCTGQEICSCAGSCDVTAGWCSPMAGFCCETDGDCEAGYVCVPTMSGLGVCEPKPKFAGKCWFDGDCPAGEACYGAFACPCTTSCGSPDQYGACLPD